MKCLSCNQPVDGHRKYTAEDIVASESATFGSPVLLPSGTKALSPLSPTLVGKFIGHDPVLPLQHLAMPGAAFTFCGREVRVVPGMVALPEHGFSDLVETYGPPCAGCQTALSRYA